MIKVKSIFTVPADDDGYRILVEPVWPRHAGHKKAGVNVWLRYLAPSARLYDLYASNSVSWEGFVARYHRELERNREYFRDLQDHNHNGGLTILHGSRSNDHNVATALKILLEQEDPVTLPEQDQDTAVTFPGHDSISPAMTQKIH